MLEAVAITTALMVGNLPTQPNTRPKYEFVNDHFVLQRDTGGDVAQYAYHFHLIKREGSRVVVEGDCFSACTMVLDNPKACAMPSARFGFHAARRYNKETRELFDISDAGNKILWSHYPPSLREWLGELKPTMVFIKGTELLPLCK
jgi:hypothetical protein